MERPVAPTRRKRGAADIQRERDRIALQYAPDAREVFAERNDIRKANEVMRAAKVTSTVERVDREARA